MAAVDLLADQDQYFNGSLSHFYWVQLTAKLTNCAYVCAGVDIRVLNVVFGQFRAKACSVYIYY